MSWSFGFDWCLSRKVVSHAISYSLLIGYQVLLEALVSPTYVICTYNNAVFYFSVFFFATLASHDYRCRYLVLLLLAFLVTTHYELQRGLGFHMHPVIHYIASCSLLWVFCVCPAEW